MGFSSYKKSVENGDTVILYFSPSHIAPLKINSGQTFQTAYGAIKHSNLIGKKYGTKINGPKGWIYLLHPTSELWTQAVPHRTQILYSTDISMIVFQLELTAGSVVVEAGTGSGSLSHAIVRSVMSTGHLFTYEFHKERFEKAGQEFVEHGMSDNVTITHRDVCNNGFQLNHVADAVFLDLPSPWSCIDSAKQALKLQEYLTDKGCDITLLTETWLNNKTSGLVRSELKSLGIHPECVCRPGRGGRICSFSPCTEQVSQTCATLTEKGFQDIKTLECLLRKFHVKHTGLPKACLGELTESETIQKVKIERKTHMEMGTNVDMAQTDESVAKKPCLENTNNPGRNNKDKKKGQDCYEFVTASPVQDMQGHTGFLTFATLYGQ